jgi:hypothetical protein
MRINFADALIGKQINIKNAVNKTIKAISTEDETLVIVYTDNTFSINSKYQYDYESYYEMDFESCYFEHLKPMIGNGKVMHSSVVSFLVEQGVVSKEILEKLNTEYIQEYNKETEAIEYKKYLILKQKFEK